MKLRDNIAVVMMVLNEEYWLDQAIKPLAEAGLAIYLADCGSTDKTPEIIATWEREHDQFYVKQYGLLTPLQNGRVREELTIQANSRWILVVDGDEILTPEGIEIIFNLDMGDWIGAMITQQVVKWDGKHVRLANKTSHRRIHHGKARWEGEYPYENTTDGNDRKDQFWYPKGMTGYHMKFLSRSSQDATTYKRVSNNERYWPYLNSLPPGEILDLLQTFGPPRFPNPYY